jgi:hypothetical protein
MQHEFNNKFIKVTRTWLKCQKHKKKLICLFLISRIMNLNLKLYTILKEINVKNMFWLNSKGMDLL